MLNLYSLCIVVLAILLPAGVDDLYAYGEVSEINSQPSTSNDDKVVRRVRFVDNHSFGNGNLRTIIRTKPNRRVLGIPGANLWYGFYQLSGGRFGEAPSLLDHSVVAQDIQRLESFYENQGFFDAHVDTSILEYKRNRVEVTFFIDEGERSKLKQVTYSGLSELVDELNKQEFMLDSPLTQLSENDTTFEANENFTYEKAINERNRIISFLRNNGYAAVQRDSVETFVRPDSINPLNLYLLYKVYPGDIYNFGDMHINVSGPQDDDITFETDTLSGEPHTIDSFSINMSKSPESHTQFSLLTNHLMFKPGERYNHDLYQRTLNQYQNLGMFTVRQFDLNTDGNPPDFNQSHLPVYLDMQTLPRHRFRTDVFGMQRVGFGAGAGISYINNNLFGNAETFEIGFKGSFEYVNSSFLRSYEANSEYTVPRLASPFSWLNNRRYFLNTRTRYRFSVAEVSQLDFNIDANFRFSQQFEVIHSKKSTSFLDLIELDWLDASATPNFRDMLFDRFSDENGNVDLLQINRILEDFNPQFSSIIRYTFRTSDTDLIKRNFGYYSEAAIEIGGNIPYLIDRFVVTSDTLEGNIPSLNLTSRSLTYSQFFKTHLDFRRYKPVFSNGVFAYRGFAGYSQPYGVNPHIPLNRRFFAGGSNDIRGWPPLRLGPGKIEQTEVSINGGEIKLAGFMEYRHTFLENVLSTDWGLAFFTDFGNIWYGHRSNHKGLIEDDHPDGIFRFNEFYNEIAVGSGFGLRLDWDYIVLRIDAAYRIHDLQEGWFNVSGNYLHFGIGHSF